MGAWRGAWPCLELVVVCTSPATPVAQSCIQGAAVGGGRKLGGPICHHEGPTSQQQQQQQQSEHHHCGLSDCALLPAEMRSAGL